jgi:predicted acyl esterase
MVIERDVPISMDDGLVIRADVYRPTRFIRKTSG